ncbi:MAG: hypothetical protein JNK70_09250, partial [Phycisphaerae bacterium]|nr:hypothetical protein [Phycisphaerae bacterium]
MTTAQSKTRVSPSVDTEDPQDRPLIWVDGQLHPKSKAMVSVYDHG